MNRQRENSNRVVRRDALMRKLARTDEPTVPDANGVEEVRKMAKPKTDTKPLAIKVDQASRCVVLKNMFDAAEYVSPFLSAPMSRP